MSFRARLTIAAAVAVAVAVAAASAVAYVAVRSELRGQVDDALARARGDHRPDPDRRRPHCGRTSSSSTSRARELGGPAATCRSVERGGTRSGRAAPTSRCPVDDADARASPRAATTRTSATPRSRAPTSGSLTDAARARLRDPGRPAADRGRRLARPPPHDPAPRRARRHRPRRRARARRRPHGARARAAADRGDRGRHRDARPLRAASPTSGRDELSRLAGELQHHARRARGLRAAPAALRRRRLARAAHPADQPPDEHRGARPRPRHAGARSASGSCGRRRAARGDERARRRARRARPRCRRSRRARGRPARPARRPTPSSARAGTAPGDVRDPTSRSRSCTACPARSSAPIGNLLDNAAKWSPPGGEVAVSLRDGERRRPGPRAGDRRRRPAARLRPLLPRPGRARHARARASGSRSSARWPRAHGGEVTAERAEGGGTLVRLRLSEPVRP